MNPTVVLVTGGAGFIGSNLCEVMLKKGHHGGCIKRGGEIMGRKPRGYYLGDGRCGTQPTMPKAPPPESKQKNCPFRKRIEISTGREKRTYKDGFVSCEGDRCMAYLDGRCLRLFKEDTK